MLLPGHNEGHLQHGRRQASVGGLALHVHEGVVLYATAAVHGCCTGTMEGGRQADVAKQILSAKDVPYFVAAPLLIQDLDSWARDGVAGALPDVVSGSDLGCRAAWHHDGIGQDGSCSAMRQLLNLTHVLCSTATCGLCVHGRCMLACAGCYTRSTPAGRMAASPVHT